MNVSLTPELEKLVDKKVSSGLYNNASEVVRDAIRRAFCDPAAQDIEQDTPELAELIQPAVDGPHFSYKKGHAKRILARVRRQVRK